MLVEIIAPCPVLNTPAFREVFGGPDGRSIPRNAVGHPFHFEFVALPPMHFFVEEIHSEHIVRVSAPEYPSKTLYIDRRFTKPICQKNKHLSFPPISEIAARMKQLLGTPYVWGGNWSRGVPEMMKYYAPRGPLDEETRLLWTLMGVDCSGLLFEASSGLTPRNTSQLVSFGSALPIEKKSATEIAALLQPMDFAVWPGHVWFVLDAKHSIESKSPFGVIKRPLLERLAETLSERTGVNAWKKTFDPTRYFVIRRLNGADCKTACP